MLENVQKSNNVANKKLNFGFLVRKFKNTNAFQEIRWTLAKTAIVVLINEEREIESKRFETRKNG